MGEGKEGQEKLFFFSHVGAKTAKPGSPALALLLLGRSSEGDGARSWPVLEGLQGRHFVAAGVAGLGKVSLLASGRNRVRHEV